MNVQVIRGRGRRSDRRKAIRRFRLGLYVASRCKCGLFAHASRLLGPLPGLHRHGFLVLASTPTHVSTVFHEVERRAVLAVFLHRATGGRLEGRLFGVSRMQLPCRPIHATKLSDRRNWEYAHLGLQEDAKETIVGFLLNTRKRRTYHMSTRPSWAYILSLGPHTTRRRTTNPPTTLTFAQHVRAVCRISEFEPLSDCVPSIHAQSPATGGVVKGRLVKI
jgi:hypothetical protein